MASPDLSMTRGIELPTETGLARPSYPSQMGLSLVVGSLSLPLLIFTYFESLVFLVRAWTENENYSHGLLVPGITTWLIWRLRDAIAAQPIRGRGWGLVLMSLAVLLYLVGELATVYAVLHLSFFIMIVGLVLAQQGTARTAIMSFPLAYLFTSIPLPMFLYQMVTGQLQLISSAVGIGCLQLVGITAFQEGNVIDLGPVQLQVVEACSGLRYLFPLVSLALLAAYLFQDRWWKRVVLVLSSIPISIVLNGLRIGLIGVLVEWYGASAADGFLHLFEGWILFVCSVGLLVLEVWFLSRLNRSPRTPVEYLRSGKTVTATSSRMPLRQLSSPVGAPPVSAAIAIVMGLAVLSTQLTTRDDIAPPRKPFLDFPLQLEAWTGQSFPLAPGYLDALRLDDYYLADYRREDHTVNVYLAYYRSQRKGQSAHSPKSCIPGGGWEIASFTTRQMPLGTGAGSIPVNRVLVKKGGEQQLVYYWFKQRDRLMSNEYMVKWFILWDALGRSRTDGALIRLATPIAAHGSEADADRHLTDVGATLTAHLQDYVPD